MTDTVHLLAGATVQLGPFELHLHQSGVLWVNLGQGAVGFTLREGDRVAVGQDTFTCTSMTYGTTPPGQVDPFAASQQVTAADLEPVRYVHA